MAHVVEINQIEHLAYYRMAWKALFGETRDATFFQSLDWLEVYWRHFGEDQKLRALFVYEGGYVGGLRRGFDPDFAPEGAGTVLYMFALEACFGCEDHTYDFGPDYQDVKRHFTNKTRTSYCYSHYPRLNFAAQNVRARRWFKRHTRGDAIGADRAKKRNG